MRRIDDGPSDTWVAITPTDGTTIARPRAIYVGTAGDIVMKDATGTAVTFKNVAVGEHPLAPIEIKSTGTTASDIVALY